MAKKNEILLSIALEGDAEIKAKLKAVGEEGKRSLSDIEKNVGRAGGAVDKFREPLGQLQKALAPLSEAGGLAGFAGLGGIFGRLASGLTSPAGIVAGITSALLGMAKLGDETQRQRGRLGALGDAGGFDKLTGQAKQLGTNVSDLQPRYEKFLAFQQKLRADNPSIIHPPNFDPGQAEEAANNVRVVGGGKNVTPPSREAFQAFDKSLFDQIRKDIGNADQAHQIAGDFEGGLFSNGKLTGDQLRALQQTSPSAANFLTGSLSQKLGRGFSNPGELANLLDRGGAQVSPTDLINEGARRAPEAAARGVTEAFGALEAASKRLAESFGGDHAGLGKGIDKAAQLVDQGATKVDQFRNAADNRPGGGNFIGPVRPEDIATAPKSVGEVFSSDKGDLLGRIVGFIRGGESGQNNGFGGGNPFGVISDFLSKALANPAALQDKVRPAEGPSAQEPVPVQPVPAANQQSSTNLLEGIAASINSLNPPNLKVEGPTTGLGIRGDAEQAGDSLKQFASVVSEVIASIKGSAGAGTVQKVQAAAGGGMIRRLDGGGGVSGPGTSTSDSIPAMLSDGEYVLRAASARKIGLARLDRLNAYADGGSVTSLSAGNHQISYDPSTGGAFIDGVLHLPGDPILQDPFVQAAIARSKADTSGGSRRSHKSDFVGTFGSYAGGGAVGHLGNAISRAFGGRTISLPGFAEGGGIDGFESVGAVSDLGSGSPWADMPHVGSMDLNTPHGNSRVIGPEDTLRHMVQNARDAAMVQTGPRPSWAYGSDR